MTRSRYSTRPMAVVLLCTLITLVLPGVAAAAPSPFGNGSVWSVPVRYQSALAPQPNGGVVANTAIANGGVPTGGDSLVGIDDSGSVNWNSPYQNQDVITAGPVVDAVGNVYRVLDPGTGQRRLIASSGMTEKWSQPITDGSDQHLAVGANGQLYNLAGNTLHGYDAIDGHELFAAVTVAGFASGSADRLFAYDKGFVAYSGSGKVWYLGYDGHTLAGPIATTTNPAGVFAPEATASATGDLFIVHYTEGLNGCLDTSGQTIVTKITPAGVAWSKPLPYVSRCNTGGPYIAATPNGGAVIASDAVAGADIQYVDGSGQAGWHQVVNPPSGTLIRSVEPVRMDTSGDALLALNFGFDCHLGSDSCLGVQVSHFLANGAPRPPIVLQGDVTNHQESWSLSGKDSLTLVPVKAVLALRHNAGGNLYGATSYSVDAFGIPELKGAYPQLTLWKSAPVGSPPPAIPPGYKCGTAKFFGLRGSGEKSFDGEGMGITVDDAKNNLAKSIPGLRFEAIDYPAVDVDPTNPAYVVNYDDSKSAGADALLKAFRQFITYCPTTYAFWSGYSQGGQVVDSAYAQLTDAERMHIAAVMIFGNPVFNPDQNVVDEGTYNPNLSGILVKFFGEYPSEVPRKWTTYVRSWCTSGDPVCNYSKVNLARCGKFSMLCSHLHYVQLGWTGKAAQWGVDHLKRLPALPVPPRR